MIPLPVEVVDGILEYLDEDLWNLRAVCTDFYELAATRIWKRVRLVYGYSKDTEGPEISIHCQNLKKNPWIVDVVARYSLFLTVDICENFFPQPENREALVKALQYLCSRDSRLMDIRVLLSSGVRFSIFLDSLLKAVLLSNEVPVSVQYSACLFDNSTSMDVAATMHQIREKLIGCNFVLNLSIFTNKIWRNFFDAFGCCIDSLSISTIDVPFHDMQHIIEKSANMTSLTMFTDSVNYHGYDYSLSLPASLSHLKVFGSSISTANPKLVGGALMSLTMSLEAFETFSIATDSVSELKLVGLNRSSDIALGKLESMKIGGLRCMKVDSGDIASLRYLESVLKDMRHVELLQLRKKGASQGTPLTFEEYKEVIGLVPNARQLILDGSTLNAGDLAIIGDILAREYPEIHSCYIAGDKIPSGLNCRQEAELIEFTGLKGLKKVFQLYYSTL